MAVNYVPSDSINVFPSVNRVNHQTSARLTSESAIVSIVNKLIDTDGFIISPSISVDDDFEFNINGYYFVIKATYKDDEGGTRQGVAEFLDNFRNDTAIYGYIVLKDVGDYAILQGQDVNNIYQGIKFVAQEPTEQPYKLLLLNRATTSDSWTIPDSSKIKYRLKSIEPITVVDGGLIDGDLI